MSLRVWIVAAHVLVVLLGTCVHWFAIGRREPRDTPESWERLHARSGRLERELAGPLDDRDWSGEYERRYATGRLRLLLGRENGFELESEAGCNPIIVNSGAVSADERGLELSSDVGFSYREDRAFGARLEFVRWGERRYLVPPDRFEDFVNEANLGRFDKGIESFFCRAADRLLPLTGNPTLSHEHARHLLAVPIAGRVVAVHKLGTEPPRFHRPCNYELVLDAGTTRGVRVGMPVALLDGHDGLRHAEVIEVEPDRAHAIVSCDGWGSHLELGVGRRWSTREE
ncbi:MAG: hypothetical protein IPJ77_01530 [Planctomycetes bacterium]|nr:hypothetical protein [Planctomycetota bacterium]